MTEQNKRDRSNASRGAKVLRGVVITLMGLTLAFTLLGGAGTTCVALGAEKYDSMASLVPYKPLYQALVVISLAVGVWGIPVMISLLRRKPKAYRNTLLVLLVGALSAGVQMGVSQSVRGSSAPVNVRFYVTAFTLAVFLLLRLPPVWERVDFAKAEEGGSSRGASAGTAFIVCGIVTLTTRFWVGATHLAPDGTNWIDIFTVPLRVSGWAMTVVGTVLLIVALGLFRRRSPSSYARHGSPDPSLAR